MKIPLDSIEDQGLLPAKLSNGDPIVLVRRGRVVTALADECPHQALPLSAGDLLPDGSIQCPWHGARFDSASGRCLSGPATDPVATYAVRVEGDHVVIDEGH